MYLILLNKIAEITFCIYFSSIICLVPIDIIIKEILFLWSVLEGHIISGCFLLILVRTLSNEWLPQVISQRSMSAPPAYGSP